MKTINRIMTNICSNKLLESKAFYTQLFDFKVQFESNWFIQLISVDKQLELGIIEMNNALVPKEYQVNPNGFYITFVVDDVDAIYKVAKAVKIEIISEPTDTFYGQRRLLLKDPSGTLVDVSSAIPKFEF